MILSYITEYLNLNGPNLGMNKMNAIRWIFFDIGSTLVDEEEAYNHRIRDMIQGRIKVVFIGGLEVTQLL